MLRVCPARKARAKIVRIRSANASNGAGAADRQGTSGCCARHRW